MNFSIPTEKIKELVELIKEQTAVDAFALTIGTGKPALTDSKIGGLPYWPKDRAIPKPNPDKLEDDEKHFVLLAQLDLTQFGNDKRLPNTGLLQFFITPDDLYGLEFNIPMDAQRRFRVIWHKEVDKTVTEADVIAQGFERPITDEFEFLPVEGEYPLSVEKTKSWMTPADVRFDDTCIRILDENLGIKLPEETGLWDVIGDDGWDTIYEGLSVGVGPQHLVLGYPFFTQFDPRDGDSVKYFDTLLFQLDSDFSKVDRVMWGDAGVGNFFINSKALERGDFERVLYNWDCY